MARGIFIVIVVGLAFAVFAAATIGSVLCAYVWNGHVACVGIYILYEWQTLVAGLFALVAASATVLAILRQVQQAEEHRNADWRRKAGSIANTIYIDLLDTSDRLRAAGFAEDLSPTFSETSRAMIPDATAFSPVLAGALQKHCIEVSRLCQTMRRDISTLREISPLHRKARYAVAFRARVLAYCFSQASLDMYRTGSAAGPYISGAKLKQLEEAFSVDESEREYLSRVFQVTGIS